MADDIKPEKPEDTLAKHEEVPAGLTPGMLLANSIANLLDREEVAKALAEFLKKLPEVQEKKLRAAGWNQVLATVLRFALAGAVVAAVWHLTASAILDKTVAATLLGGIVGSIFVSARGNGGTKS